MVPVKRVGSCGTMVMDSLRSLSSPTARVIRGGQQSTIPSIDIVPGDVIEIKTAGIKLSSVSSTIVCKGKELPTVLPRSIVSPDFSAATLGAGGGAVCALDRIGAAKENKRKKTAGRIILLNLALNSRPIKTRSGLERGASSLAMSVCFKREQVSIEIQLDC